MLSIWISLDGSPWGLEIWMARNMWGVPEMGYPNGWMVKNGWKIQNKNE